MIAFLGGSIIVSVSAVFLIKAIRANLVVNRNLLGISIFVGLTPLVTLSPYLSMAISLPLINDISTDTVNPPKFEAVVPLWAAAPVSVEDVRTVAWPADKLASATRAAYPDLKTLSTDISARDAVRRSVTILDDMGLEIIASDVIVGRVEATATSFWFGFKDDLVVRVAYDEGSVKIDLRSKSRIGQSDFGSNASRIREFIRRF